MCHVRIIDIYGAIQMLFTFYFTQFYHIASIGNCLSISILIPIVIEFGYQIIPW